METNEEVVVELEDEEHASRLLETACRYGFYFTTGSTSPKETKQIKRLKRFIVNDNNDNLAVRFSIRIKDNDLSLALSYGEVDFYVNSSSFPSPVCMDVADLRSWIENEYSTQFKFNWEGK